MNFTLLINLLIIIIQIYIQIESGQASLDERDAADATPAHYAAAQGLCNMQLY